MSDSKQSNWVRVLLWSVLVLVAAFLCLHVFSFSGISQRWFAKRVQHAVLRSETSLNLDKDCLLSESLSYPNISSTTFSSLSPHSEIFFFDLDSLMYWSSNVIDPKIVRKRVPIGVDTILHLGCGDFLFVSASHHGQSFYLFQLLNTQYPFENSFFENCFQLFFTHKSVQFHAVSQPGCFPVSDHLGKTLGYFNIINQGSFGFSSLSWLVVCLMIIVLCAYLLIFRRITLIPHALSHPAFQGSSLLPVSALALLFFTMIWAFPALCRYGFKQGFFIPSTLSLNWVFFAYFIGFLLFTTVLLGIQTLFIRYFSFKKHFWWYCLAYLVLLVVLTLVFSFHWAVLLLGVLLFLCFVLFTRYRNLGDLLLMAVQFVLWGILFTVLYQREFTQFENREIQQMACSLADERDPEFEHSYQRFLTDVQGDTTFLSTVLTYDVMEEVVEDYMRTFLFDSVMNQYDVKLTLCDPGAELEVQPEGVISDCMNYFQDLIELNHGQALGDGLCFLDYHTLDPSYLSMIHLLVDDTLSDLNLFLEFSKPILPQVFGLPGLLQHGTLSTLQHSSVACYQDSVLVYKNGSYVYPNFLSDFRHQPNGFSHSVKMKHYTYQVDDSKLVAVSVNRRSTEEMTTPFVFFFFFPLVLFLMAYFVGGLNSNRVVPNTLRRKFQTMILLTLGVAFPLVGTVSVIFMNDQYMEKSKDYHFERTRSLLQDLSSEVDFSFLRHPGFKYDLDRVLWHYSKTFFTDINIYGLDGRLLATTCPEIQDLHLQASLMNAEAFQNMQGERSLYYSHDERLGKAYYQSSYIAIQDGTGKTLAYLNTPYFASRSGLRAELVTFVLTYINIILAVIFVVTGIVLVVSWRVTYPLTQLQERMRQIDLNKSNEMLEWKSKDEIGALVKQYNQLVVELEKSASELRRTATELAWRGVARQVAHEIKNSLTPMRLSLQMLQRSIEKGADDVNEKVMRTSNTLIEQIDALSDIAASFSTYAKLPENHPQPLDLAELVNNVVQLYDHYDNIEFRFEHDPAVDYTINGDKTNLNSAIGNIVKNATQAIGSKPDGHIDVTLSALSEVYRISICDNGKGIKEEDKKMIFLPNFTTKSGGSGVGLSLTYNIIHSAGGTISFVSEEGKGAEFVIELPKMGFSM